VSAIEERDKPDLGRRRFLLLSRDESAPAPAEAEKDAAPVAVIVDHIRLRSRQGSLARRQDFSLPPFQLDEAALTSALAEVADDVDYGDIASLEGEKDRFYYSTATMTTNYATILLWLADRDSCRIVADVVRLECETYPRPLPVGMLRGAPYCFDEERLGAALALLGQSAAYDDIKQVRASNGELYLYSDKSMSYPEAKGLCEWLEVKQHANP
jgi:hypothetical protein